MEIKQFKKGKIIFREGDTADCMLGVAMGRVGVYAAYGTAEQKLLREYYPDSSLGEMGLLEHKPRSATAVALDDNTCVEFISEESFGEFFRSKPVMVLKIMQELSGNLRRTSRDYAEVCSKIQALAEKEGLK